MMKIPAIKILTKKGSFLKEIFFLYRKKRKSRKRGTIIRKLQYVYVQRKKRVTETGISQLFFRVPRRKRSKASAKKKRAIFASDKNLEKATCQGTIARKKEDKRDTLRFFVNSRQRKNTVKTVQTPKSAEGNRMAKSL